MSLSDLIAADVNDVFMNTDDFAVAVTVQRGSGWAPPTACFNAIVTQCTIEVTNEFGTLRHECRTYEFPIEKYDFHTNHGPVLPEHGDIFTEAGSQSQYAVAAPEGVSIYSIDENRQLLTVRTTRVK